jgi:hypothetical protein
VTSVVVIVVLLALLWTGFKRKGWL